MHYAFTMARTTNSNDKRLQGKVKVYHTDFIVSGALRRSDGKVVLCLEFLYRQKSLRHLKSWTCRLPMMSGNIFHGSVTIDGIDYYIKATKHGDGRQSYLTVTLDH